jgi:hypothetical protein
MVAAESNSMTTVIGGSLWHLAACISSIRSPSRLRAQERECPLCTSDQIGTTRTAHSGGWYTSTRPAGIL